MKKSVSAKRLLDEFAQPLGALHSISATDENVTNTKISSTYSSKDKVGMVMHLVEYNFEQLDAALNTAGDNFDYGLCAVSAQPVTGFYNYTGGVIDFNTLERIDFGTAANAIIQWGPVVKDFSGLPRGGVLTHPNFLYTWSHTRETLGAAINMWVKIWYTVVELSDSDYMDLWQNLVVNQVI